MSAETFRMIDENAFRVQSRLIDEMSRERMIAAATIEDLRRRNARLALELGAVSRRADQAIADLQAIRSAALDAIAANKEIPKC